MMFAFLMPYEKKTMDSTYSQPSLTGKGINQIKRKWPFSPLYFDKQAKTPIYIWLHWFHFKNIFVVHGVILKYNGSKYKEFSRLKDKHGHVFYACILCIFTFIEKRQAVTHLFKTFTFPNYDNSVSIIYWILRSLGPNSGLQANQKLIILPN